MTNWANIRTKKKEDYVIDSLNRKIPSYLAISIDGIFYDSRKNNPPLVVKKLNKNYSYEYILFIKEDCIKINNNYYHKDDMIKVYFKNGTVKEFGDRENIMDEIGEKEYNCLLQGKNESNYILFETMELANKKGFFISCEHNSLVPKKDVVKKTTNKIQYKKFKNSRSNSDQFNSKKEAINYGVMTGSTIGTGGMKYTFGVEIETCSGKIPDFIYRNAHLNLDAVHDGSLRDEDNNVYGGEYVTGVLKGDAGLANLYRSVKAINSYCNISNKCGIHVHIGGANFNEKFTIFSYMLALKIEKEIYQIFPPSRRNNDYTSGLKKWDFKKYIDEHGEKYGVSIAYEELYKDMANANHVKGRELGKKINKFTPHPGGRYTDRYSNGVALEHLYRYKWFNLIPCNFNTRNAHIDNSKPDKGVPLTLEFRPHSASMNFSKIKNWTLFCMAFTYFVENNSKSILENEKITINDILNFGFSKSKVDNEKLTSYFDERKKRFTGKIGIANEKLEYSENVEHNATKTREIIKS